MREALVLEEIAIFPIRSERFPEGRPNVVPSVVCHDDFTMSIQASSAHHCTPQDDDGPWIEFEVNCIDKDQFLSPYLSEALDDIGTSIYTNVPLDVLRKVIDNHGGIVIDGQTYTYVKQDVSVKHILSQYIMYPSIQSFIGLQESLRSVNHLDKHCASIQCHQCSYFKSALTGSEHVRNGQRAFCPFTAATHKSIVSVSSDNDRAEVVGELLDLLKEQPRELSVEDL